MTSYYLRYLTLEERQERARQREANTPAELVAQERARQREAKMLAELDADVLPSTLNGRPRIELPPKIARRVLDDLGVGASYQSIVKKYRHIQRFLPGGCERLGKTAGWQGWRPPTPAKAVGAGWRIDVLLPRLRTGRRQSGIGSGALGGVVPGTQPKGRRLPRLSGAGGDAHYLGCPRKERLPAEPPAGGLGKWLRRKLVEGRTGPG